MTSAKVFYITNFIFFFTLLIVLITLYLIVTSRNPIKVILFLIAFFFEVAFLFIYCGADYLGVLLLLLYAGAVSIILLFVVMLLDMKELLVQKEKFSLPLNLLLLSYYCCVLKAGAARLILGFYTFMSRNQYLDWFELSHRRTNIEVIGWTLYNYYIIQLVAIGIGLFVVMVLVISLIVNYNLLVKKQVLRQQLYPRKTLKFYE